jgi:hypothetical protein
LENTTRCGVILPLSRGADFSWLCFGTPDFSTANSQMRMALFHISLVASENCSRLGFGSSRMLLSWQ